MKTVLALVHSMGHIKVFQALLGSSFDAISASHPLPADEASRIPLILVHAGDISLDTRGPCRPANPVASPSAICANCVRVSHDLAATPRQIPSMQGRQSGLSPCCPAQPCSFHPHSMTRRPCQQLNAIVILTILSLETCVSHATHLPARQVPKTGDADGLPGSQCT